MEDWAFKRRTLLKTTAAGVVTAAAGVIDIQAQAKAAKRPLSAKTSGLVDQLITQNWTFKSVEEGQWLPATVPGTVHTDLLANKSIEDPFYRLNEHDQQWIDKKDWEYRTTFNVTPATFARKNIELFFEGLDTYADVYVNDKLVLSADNMFREWTIDVKTLVKPGANALRILFHSPIEKGLKALATFGFNPPAANDQSENGGVGNKQVSVFTRKAGYHYGWDWGPRFVTSGIWRPVHLRAWDTAKLLNIQIVQNTVTKDKATLTAAFEIEADRASTVFIDVQSPTDPRIKARAQVTLTPGINKKALALVVDKPKLWWTNGLGEAFLYTLTASLSSQTALLDTRSVKVGLRTLKIVQTPDAQGESFYVELNGVPVFMKGANYIPNDSFLPRVTPAVYDKVIHSAVDTHMNMLRVWGGGVYESDYFYDQCDAHGILVWHDFMFACSMYPDDEAFLDNVREEAVQNVKRLRNHPCIALWVGNNEIDSAWQNDVPNGGWGWKPRFTDEQKARLWTAYDAIFHKILPTVIAEYDPQRFYWPSSPLASWDGHSGVKHADIEAKTQIGDIHYWDVWGGHKPFQEYRTHVGRFVSEYGFQSFPEFNTIKDYAIPADFDIFSEVMQSHQRATNGNANIKGYMERDYKVPADFRQFLYVGQVLQAEGIKVAMEAHRTRMPYCMGSLFWQINDCWPVASWSSIDYFGRWKAQQFFARKAFDTVLVSPQIEGSKVAIYAVNDRLVDVQATVLLKVMDFGGKVLSQTNQPLTLKANTGAVYLSEEIDHLLAGAAPDTVLLSVQLNEGTKRLSDNVLYFKPIKDVKLPKPVILKSVKASGADILIGLTSKALVKNLYLSLDGVEGRFSDNYFDILPNETAAIRFTPAKAMTPKTFEAKLRLMHMQEI